MSRDDSQSVGLTVGEAVLPDGLAATATHGIPFPRGVLTSPEQIEVSDSEGRQLQCQGQALSKYEDGSIQWLLLDFLAPVTKVEMPPVYFMWGHNFSKISMPPPSTVDCELRYGEGASCGEYEGALEVEEDEERIVVTSRRMRLIDELRSLGHN